MSYINEALKKAQEEKNSRYGKQDDSASVASVTKRKRTLPPGWGKFAALSFFSVGIALLGIVFIVSPPSMDFPFFAMPAKTAEAPAGPAEKTDVSAVEKSPVAKAANEKALEKSPSASFTAGTKNSQEDKRAAELKDLTEEAATASRKGNFSKARALYEKALKLAPENGEVLNNLGVVYLAQKKREKALSLFRRAILLKRDYVDPYYNMACFYAQENDIDQSLWYLKIAISMDRDVVNWVKKDADMKMVAASPKFKEIDGGAKN